MLKLFVLTLTFTSICNAAVLPSGCLDAFRSAAFKAHNIYRSMHGSIALIEDLNIDSNAQLYAEFMASSSIFDHSKNRDNTGENIYGKYTLDPLTAAMCYDIGSQCVKNWYDQIKYYNFSNPGYTIPTGYFTQLVWKDSTKVGLGLGSGTYMGYNAFYCVAQYQPAGNVVLPGYFQANVLPPILTTIQPNPSTTTSLPISDNLPIDCLSSFRQAAIQAHNSYRSKHSAPSLIEENQINLSAHLYAQQLAITNNLIPSTNRVDTGENLYVTYTAQTLTSQMCAQIGTECVKSWYNEVSSPGYNFNSPGYSLATSHFTQLVWKNTRKVGLGLSLSKFNGQFNAIYCVSQYQPVGNINTIESFQANVLPSIY